MKNQVSTVTTRGRLVIPSKLRRKFAIRKGTQVAFLEEENRLVLQPLPPNSSTVYGDPSKVNSRP